VPDVLDDPLITYTNRSISGGMNDKVFPTQIRDDQVAELFDVDISTPGRRKKRKGYEIIGNDAGSDQVNALADFKPEGGTHLLLHRAGTNLRSWSGSGNWADIDTGLVSGAQANIIQAFNLAMVLQGGGGNVHSYDGSTLTDEGNTNADPPLTTHGVWLQNRLFLAGNSSNPLYLYYSDPLDPQTFDRGANVVKFDEGFGADINGVVDWNKNTIVVATDKNIHVLDISDATPSNWSRELISPNFGCAAFRTLIRVGNDVWYLGQDAKVRSVLRTQQDAIRGGDNPVTEAIESFLVDIDKTKLDESVAVFYNEAYYLSIPITGSSRNTHVIKVDTQTQGITIYKNWSVQDWAVSKLVGSEERLYGGESQADTKLYRFETGTSDNGTAIEYNETTKRIDFGQPGKDKRFQWIELETISGGAGTLTVEAQINGGGYSVIGTIDLSSDQPSLAIDLPFDLGGSTNSFDKLDLDAQDRGRDIQFRFTNPTLDLDVAILGYTVAAFIEEIESE